MFKINHDIFTFISYEQQEDIISFTIGKSKRKGTIFSGPEFTSVSKVRQSLGYEVRNYIELVHCIAEISYTNNSYNILFRGQSSDIKDKNGKTTLYPSIYRPGPGRVRLSSKLQKERFINLNESIQKLRQNRYKINFHKGLSDFKEYQIALLQHYKLELTPLLDLTKSLLVAASFSLNDSNEGYLYVLGMPHNYGSISLFVDHSMRIVNLQSVSPPEAIRPHFQDGFLVGRLPYTRKRNGNDNFANRLIAKIKLVNHDNKFWIKGFNKVSKKLLFPPKDEFELKLKNILGKNV